MSLLKASDHHTPSRGFAGLRVLAGVSPFRVVVSAIVAGILFLIVYPLGRMLVRTFYSEGALQTAAFAEVMAAPWIGDVARDTSIVVVTSGVMAILIASLFAWINERTDGGLGIFGLLIPLVPLLLPSVAVAIGWTFLASERVGFLTVALDSTIGRLVPGGITLNIYSWTGLIGLYTIFLVPYAYLIISAALRNIDPSLEEASRVSGGSVFATARKISLPAVAPAILGAGLLLVIEGMSFFAAPVIVAPTAGIDILSVRVIRMLTAVYPPRIETALVLSTVLMFLIAVLWALQRRIVASGKFATISGRARTDTRIALGPWRWVARGVILAYFVAASVLPLSALVLVSLQPFWTGYNIFANLSFQHYADIFGGNTLANTALRNSILIGIFGGGIGILLAGVLALYMRSAHPSVGRLLDMISKLPAAVPHVIVAIGFLIAFGGSPFFLAGTIQILLLAYLVIYLPQASIAASAAAHQVGNEMSEASAICGAGQGRTLRRILLPLMAPGLVAGWALLFVHMSGELTAASILANANTPVVGFVILDIFESGTFGPLAALATVISVMSSIVIALITILSTWRQR